MFLSSFINRNVLNMQPTNGYDRTQKSHFYLYNYFQAIHHPVESIQKENFYAASSFPTKPQSRKRMAVLWSECTKTRRHA